VSITVVPGSSAVLLTERWGRSWAADWVPFGTPLPEIVRDGAHRWFWNHGDGSYTSGAYSRKRYSAAIGLGLEAVVRAPVLAPQWQTLNLTVTADLDSTRLAAWNHRDGGPPTSVGVNAPTFTLSLPAGEGPPGFQKVMLLCQDHAAEFPGSAWLSGKPHRFRMQIFPDGRCGLAVDGRPVLILSSALPPSARYQVMLNGNSVGSRILVGPVDVWQGVRTDVDWAAALPR